MWHSKVRSPWFCKWTWSFALVTKLPLQPLWWQMKVFSLWYLMCNLRCSSAVNEKVFSKKKSIESLLSTYLQIFFHIFRKADPFLHVALSCDRQDIWEKHKRCHKCHTGELFCDFENCDQIVRCHSQKLSCTARRSKFWVRFPWKDWKSGWRSWIKASNLQHANSYALSWFACADFDTHKSHKKMAAIREIFLCAFSGFFDL